VSAATWAAGATRILGAWSGLPVPLAGYLAGPREGLEKAGVGL